LTDLISFFALIPMTILSALVVIASPAALTDLVSLFALVYVTILSVRFDLASSATLADLIGFFALMHVTIPSARFDLASSANLADMISVFALMHTITPSAQFDLASSTNLADLISVFVLMHTTILSARVGIASPAALMDLVSLLSLVYMTTLSVRFDLTSSATLPDLISFFALMHVTIPSAQFDLTSPANLADMISVFALMHMTILSAQVGIASSTALTDLVSLFTLVCVTIFSARVGIVGPAVLTHPIHLPVLAYATNLSRTDESCKTLRSSWIASMGLSSNMVHVTNSSGIEWWAGSGPKVSDMANPEEMTNSNLDSFDDEEGSDWERCEEKRKLDPRSKSKPKSKGQPAAKRKKVVRSNSPTSGTTKTTVTVTRTSRKKNISLLLTMPLDVIFASIEQLNLKVFLELEPKDLVSLTRTSKSLRETLMAQNSFSVWKSVREDYVATSKFTTVFPGQDSALLDLIPYTDTGGRVSSSRYFLKADIEDIIRQWNALKVISTAADTKQNVNVNLLEEFRQERRAFVADVFEDAPEYLEWLEQSNRKRDVDSRERRKVRAAAIRQKFLDMGYPADDILSIMEETSVGSPNELTVRGWARIRPGLEKILIKMKDQRLEKERQKRISRRLDKFKKAFDTYIRTLLPPMWLQYPHWREAASFPVFDEILGAPDDVAVDETSLMPAMEQHLPGLVTTWLGDRKAKLTQLASAHASHPQVTRADFDVLNLATSVFQCGNSSCVNNKPAWRFISANPLFGWTDAAHHICEDSRYYERYGQIIPVTLVKTAIGFFQEASVVAAQLVQLVGLNPSQATAADMDKGAHYFFCSGCFPWRTALTWRSAIPQEGAVAGYATIAPPTSRRVGLKLLLWNTSHPSMSRALALIATLLSIARHGIENPQDSIDFFCYRRERLQPMALSYWQRPSEQAGHIQPASGPSTAQSVKNPRLRSATQTAHGIRCEHCDGSRLFDIHGVKQHLRAK
ncbi:hypothetical protein DXG01_013411, partial [Tephrocybe rancida]